MGIFSKEKEESKVVLILDIGSSSIGGALVETGDGTYKTIFSTNEQLVIEENINIDRLFSLTIKSLDIILGRIFNQHLPAPSRIICVLPSLWHVLEIRRIGISKNTPFLFTPKLADELLRKEATLFQEEHSNDYGDLLKDGMEPMELKTMKTVLNGYHTDSPFGKRAKELEMSVFISFAPRDVLEKLRNTIHKYFHNMELKFSSSILISFTGTRDMSPQSDFLLVEAGGEITDVSIIKRGELCGSVSFPLGCNFIIRKIAEQMNSSVALASSLFSLHQSGHMENNSLRKVGLIMNSARAEWIKSFEKAISGILDDVSVPSFIFLLTEPEFADFIVTAIRMEQANQHDWAEKIFQPTILHREIIRALYFERFI